MSQWRRASLGADFGYQPGEQPATEGGWLKLNTNESPLHCSPTVADAVKRAANDLHLYPNPYGEPLRTALAEYHRVSPDQVAVGNGADSILDWCFRAFTEPGDAIAISKPTYSLLPTLAKVFCLDVHEYPTKEFWDRDPGIGKDGAPLRFVVNPDSPTGYFESLDQLESTYGESSGVTVIDEAYADFADSDSAITLLDKHPNWVVVRTFSKSFALAGLRVGYAVSSADVIADLLAVKDSYPLDRCAIAGAVAALQDTDHHQLIVDTVVTQRERLTKSLQTTGWIVAPSQANFVFVAPPVLAATLAADLRQHQILVRHFDVEPLQNWLRITVGSAEQVDRLLAAFA